MSTLAVSLFGKFCIHCDEQVLESLEPQKVQELFCYLLLFRDRAHPREALANMLWGDTSTHRSKSYLRKALWQLQSALAGQTRSITSDVLLVDPDWVQINPSADLWLDVAVFERGFTRFRGILGEQLDSESAQTLGSAVNLYHGDLLAGWYQDWCLRERERLQDIFLALLDKLMGYCEAHAEYEEGLTYGAQILRYERAREQTYRRLMRLQFLAGDRTAALREYERCVAALAEELGVSPTPYTTALYEQMRANRLDCEVAPHQVQAASAMTLPVPDVLERLQQLQDALAEFKREVHQDILTLKQALSRQG